MSLLDNGENQVSQKRFILTIELPHSICTPPPSRLVSFPDPLAIETFQVRRRTCLLRPKIRLNGAFPGRVFHYYALLLSSHNVLHYALCSMHLHHFYHPHTMNVLLYISTMTSHEVLLLNVLLCTSISPHRMATDLPPPTSPHSLYSLAPKSNQRRICQQYPKYLKTKHRQKWRSI